MRTSGVPVWTLLLIGCFANGRLGAENFIAPYAGELYLKCVGGSAGAISQFGLSTTAGNFVAYLRNLPSWCPTTEVAAGTVSAGQAVPFAIRTSWSGQTYWAFAGASDQASRVAFGNTSGTIIQQTTQNTWVLHLDDAASYLVDDNNTDILMQIRVDGSSAGTGATTTTLDFEPPFPQSLQPTDSYLNGSLVSSGARITNQYQGVVMSGAALVALGQGQAASGIYGIAPIGTSSTIDYRAPMTFAFSGSTDYFSITGDRSGSSGNTVVLTAYGTSGQLLTSRSYVETSNGQKFELTGIGSFQSVTVQMVTGNPANGGIGFDLVTFGTVTGAGTPSSAQPRVGGFQTCTLSTISGPYGYAISGMILGSAGTTPFAEYGTLLADGHGSFTGTATESLGGTIVTSGVSGGYTINANCSGSATLQAQGQTIDVALTVVNRGNQLDFIQTDAGTVISGTAERGVSACDSSAFSGAYTYALNGWVSVGSKYQPFADAGRIMADGKGSLTGKSTYSASGTIGRRTLAGGYAVGSGCSGSATLTDSLGNAVTLTMTIVDNGQTVLFIQTQDGTTIAGRAHRGQYACSNASLSGSYSYSIGGYVVNDAINVPVADSGLLTADGQGNFNGSDAISQGGTVHTRNLSAAYTVNTDCTGSAALNDTLGNRLNLDIFVADGGNEVEFVQTDTGTVLSGEGQHRNGGSCNNTTIAGAYGYAIEGWVAGSGIKPFADSGQITASGLGSFSGSGTSSLGGLVVPRTLSGSYQVNADCGGTATFRDSLGNVANLNFNVTADGHELTFVQLDSGTMVSGHSQRVFATPSEGIVSAATFDPAGVVPGSLFSIFGDNLATNTAQAPVLPLSAQLGGATVSVNGKPVPLYYVRADIINAQLPVDLPPGPAQLVVTVAGNSSSPVNFSVANAGPGIFTYGLGRAVAVNTDHSVNGPQSPAHSGDTIVVYLTGGGPVQTDGLWQSGVAAPLALSRVTMPFTVTIGGEPAAVDYLGLTPTTVGLYNLNVKVPSLPAGDHSLILTVGGKASASALVSIAP